MDRHYHGEDYSHSHPDGEYPHDHDVEEAADDAGDALEEVAEEIAEDAEEAAEEAEETGEDTGEAAEEAAEEGIEKAEEVIVPGEPAEKPNERQIRMHRHRRR